MKGHASGANNDSEFDTAGVYLWGWLLRWNSRAMDLLLNVEDILAKRKMERFLRSLRQGF